MRRTCLALGCVVTLLLAAASVPVRAATVTWQLGGTIGGIWTCCGGRVGGEIEVADPALTSLGVVQGAPWTARIYLESGAADIDPSPTFGHYLAVTGFEYSAGSYYTSTGGPGGVPYGSFIVNPDQETSILILSGSEPGTGASFDLPTAGFEITAAVPGTIPSDALFVDPLPVANLHPYDPGELYWGFGTTLALISGADPPTGLQIRSALASWVTVPEPESLALFALTCLSLAMARRRA